MMEDMYLSPEDYKIAEKHGISRDVAYTRFYRYNWSKQRAITTPVEKRDKVRSKWRKVATRNGISARVFDDRVRAGWSFERAATTPVLSREEVIQINRKAKCKVFTIDQIETAKKNGIPYGTALARVRKYGWTVQKAITVPVDTRFRRKRKEVN